MANKFSALTPSQFIQIERQGGNKEKINSLQSKYIHFKIMRVKFLGGEILEDHKYFA